MKSSSPWLLLGVLWRFIHVLLVRNLSRISAGNFWQTSFNNSLVSTHCPELSLLGNRCRARCHWWARRQPWDSSAWPKNYFPERPGTWSQMGSRDTQRLPTIQCSYQRQQPQTNSSWLGCWSSILSGCSCSTFTDNMCDYCSKANLMMKLIWTCVWRRRWTHLNYPNGNDVSNRYQTTVNLRWEANRQLIPGMKSLEKTVGRRLFDRRRQTTRWRTNNSRKVWRWRGKAHAYSPSSSGKSDEKPSVIHTRR